MVIWSNTASRVGQQASVLADLANKAGGGVGGSLEKDADYGSCTRRSIHHHIRTLALTTPDRCMALGCVTIMVLHLLQCG
jgi:hypothetical protein